VPSISSWRDLLKEVISDPPEKERIAREMNINPATLVRWSQGISQTPRPHKLRQLVAAFPAQHRALLDELLQDDYSELQESKAVPESDQIDYGFLRQFWETRASTSIPLQFWALSGKVLQNALRQLDPASLGLAITVAQLMPLCDQGVSRSLREVTGLATPPWPRDMEHYTMFLGLHSLVGYSVSHWQPSFIDDLREKESFLPIYRTDYEISAAAIPIIYANRMAGCLLLSSTQPGYFRPEGRRSLIKDYAQLLACAFQPDEFFEADQIKLHLMPPLEDQQPFFLALQQKVSTVMKNSILSGKPLTRRQAEDVVWRQIEEELLRLALERHEHTDANNGEK
jgi:hypothetical protein